MSRRMQCMKITCLGQIQVWLLTCTSMSLRFLIFPRGNHFHDMGCFSNLFVVCVVLTCSPMYFLTMFHLRQKLGVTIQHLIGSDMEPLLLGCGDSTKVHPKVTKPLSKAKIAFSCATCNILAQCNCLAGASVSFQVLILFRHCRHHV